MASTRGRTLRDQSENQSTSSLIPGVHPLLGKDTKQLRRPALGELRNRKKVERVEGKAADPSRDCLNLDSLSRSLPATGVEDIDQDDWENPQLCAEYVNEIYTYMRQLEIKFTVPRDYIGKQRDINEKMRAILIDWLVQVHLRFHLLPETLYMTISIIDRYLASEQVTRGKLQLVGVTAMFVASKYEEIYAPELRDFVYITDNAYTGKQIRDMERHMLAVLNHDLGKPLPLHFLRRNSKAGQVDADIHSVAKYLMELSLQDYTSLEYCPSEIAAAALWISLKVNGSAITWNPTLVHYSTYTEKDLKPCVNHLARLVKESATSKLQAVRNKYSTSKFLNVSSKPGLQPSNIMKMIS